MLEARTALVLLGYFIVHFYFVGQSFSLHFWYFFQSHNPVRGPLSLQLLFLVSFIHEQWHLYVDTTVSTVCSIIFQMQPLFTLLYGTENREQGNGRCERKGGFHSVE